MPKDKSRKSEPHWLTCSGLSQKGETSGEGRTECNCPETEFSKLSWTGPVSGSLLFHSLLFSL